MKLIKEQVPDNDYVLALRRIGHQYGCETIEDHIMKLADEVECYTDFGLDYDEYATRDVVSSNPAAMKVFEAYFACKNSRKIV
jgi:hypothetical protein